MTRSDDSGYSIGIASTAELSVLGDMLRAEALPHQGVEQSVTSRFLIARDAAGNVLGGIGLERCGRHALLRSLVVSPICRRAGLGETLVAAIETVASDDGVSSLYLLTTTAPDFFARLGYRPADRDHVPDAIRKTDEFSRLCPDDARCLVKPLTAGSVTGPTGRSQT